MGATDIGSAATVRTSFVGYTNYTQILLENPASANFTMGQIEIWAANNLSNVKSGSFYPDPAAPDFTNRDFTTIGAVTSGSKQTFTGFTVTVTNGDYIGMIYTAGDMRMDDSGYAGVYTDSGDNFDPGTYTYSLRSGDTMSLWGTIAAAPTGIEDKCANMGAKMIAGKLI